MGHRRTRAATMAELAEAVRQDAAARDLDRSAEAASPTDPYGVQLGSRRYDVQVEPGLTPEEAQALATSSRLVVRDSCGCGGGCGYDPWTGSGVVDLVRGGAPVVEHGELLALLDRAGAACGVLVVQDVRWGRLDRRDR